MQPQLFLFRQLNDPAGSQSLSSQLDKLHRIVHGGDTAGRFHLHIRADILGKQLNIPEGRAALGETGGGLDVVGAGLGDQSAHGNFFLVSQQAGLNDNLQDAVAADSLQGLDLFQNLVGLSGLQVADIDDHVDLVGTVIDGVLSLEGLHSGGIVAVGESDDRADFYAALNIFGSFLYKGGGNADGCGPVGDGIIADDLDLGPCGGLSKQGVVYAGENGCFVHDKNVLSKIV